MERLDHALATAEVARVRVRMLEDHLRAHVVCGAAESECVALGRATLLATKDLSVAKVGKFEIAIGTCQSVSQSQSISQPASQRASQRASKPVSHLMSFAQPFAMHSYA